MDWLQLLVFPAIRALILIFVLLTGFAYLTWYERKLLARFQVRYGPNRAGKFGLLQPAADAVKAFFKEEIIPNHVDKPVYLLAPALALVPALIIWAVIPIAKGTPAIADVNIGFLWILAVAGIESYGIILAGWSSNNNYSLLGALRSSAQMVSYELPLGLFLVSILMLAGSFSLVDLVECSRQWWEWIWLWLAVPFFFICILAETNRSPFDLPETENELVAGFQTEYGGMKFALFFIAEYVNMISTSASMATLFFGGWNGPTRAWEKWVAGTSCTDSAEGWGAWRSRRFCAGTAGFRRPILLPTRWRPSSPTSPPRPRPASFSS